MIINLEVVQFYYEAAQLSMMGVSMDVGKESCI